MEKSFEYYKNLSIQMWTFLHENPDADKEYFERYNEVKDFFNHCPLCAEYRNRSEGCCLRGCPLVFEAHTCYDNDHIYDLWSNSIYPEIRQAASLIILNSIRKWTK